MSGLELIGTIVAAVIVIAIVVREARGREIADIERMREADDFANVVREEVLTKKRAEAYKKMRRHRIKHITERQSIGIYRDAKTKPSAPVYAIKGGR